MKKIKGVIFDLDGTLLSSTDVWRKIDVEFLGKGVWKCRRIM